MASVLGSSHGPLARAIRRARQLDTLNNLFNQLVGKPLRQHCQVANLRQQTLIVHVDSPAWATRLRYQQSRLLTQLRALEQYSQITELKIQVKPVFSKRAPARRPALPGQAAREQASRQLAQVRDPQLRGRLARLLATASKPG